MIISIVEGVPFEVSEVIHNELMQRGFIDGIDQGQASTILAMFRVRNKIHSFDFSRGLKPRVLHAHGIDINGVWNYELQEGLYLPVQQWVNKYDGKASPLLIASCNPKNYEIESQSSVVLNSKGNTIMPLDSFIRDQMRIYNPGEGYVYDKRRRWFV